MKQRGFTLLEMLIAVTVFVSLMAGVTLLFTSSVRTVKQSEQAREAFDMARGALHVQEEDLVTAFSARDRGDVRKFFGTPVGMVFIGAVKDSNGVAELARITYVVHESPLLPARTLELPAGEETSSETKEVKVYSLLRYVEKGVEDLETFPVDWGNTRVDSDSPSPVTLAQCIQDMLDFAQGTATPSAAIRQWEDELCMAGDERCRATLELSLKRRLWIQLLTGEIPGFWKNDANDTSDKPDPRDYVVLENVVSDHEPTLGIPSLAELWFPGQDMTKTVLYRKVGGASQYTTLYVKCFFQYGISEDYTAGGGSSDPVEMALRWSPYWHDLYNVFSLQREEVSEADKQIQLGSPLLPRSPQLVRSQFQLSFESPYPGAPPFVRQFDQEVDLRTGYTRASFREP